MVNRPMTEEWPERIIIKADSDFRKRLVADADSGECCPNVISVGIHIGPDMSIAVDVTAFVIGPDGKIAASEDPNDLQKFTRPFFVDHDAAFAVTCERAIE